MRCYFESHAQQEAWGIEVYTLTAGEKRSKKMMLLMTAKTRCLVKAFPRLTPAIPCFGRGNNGLGMFPLKLPYLVRSVRP